MRNNKYYRLYLGVKRHPNFGRQRLLIGLASFVLAIGSLLAVALHSGEPETLDWRTKQRWFYAQRHVLGADTTTPNARAAASTLALLQAANNNAQKTRNNTPTPPQQPSLAAPTTTTAGLAHQNIITTEFFAGEPADASNGYINNVESAWLANWKAAFGGFDDPKHRNGYYPSAFTPKENPFYFALPYNDIDVNGKRKATATNCLTVSGNPKTSYSWCKNVWIKVTFGTKTAYAQWEDVGPFEEDDAAYVFGTAAPKNTDGEHAGLDLSPAMQTYLGLSGLNKTSWQFVLTKDVPDGPWKQIGTGSLGYKVD